MTNQPDRWENFREGIVSQEWIREFEERLRRRVPTYWLPMVGTHCNVFVRLVAAQVIGSYPHTRVRVVFDRESDGRRIVVDEPVWEPDEGEPLVLPSDAVYSADDYVEMLFFNCEELACTVP